MIHKKINRHYHKVNYNVRLFLLFIIFVAIAATLYLVSSLNSLESSDQDTIHELSSIENASAAATPNPAEGRYRFNQRHTAFANTNKDFLTTPTLAWTFPPAPTATVKYCQGILDGSSARAPVANSTTVFVYCSGAGDNSTAPGQGIFALDINTGAVKWRNPLMSNVVGQGTAACPVGSGSVLAYNMELVGNTLYTYACSRTAIALNISNGSLKWAVTLPTGNNPSAVNAPIVATNRVFISASKGTAPVGSYLAALDINTGATIWSKATTGPIRQDPASSLDFSRVFTSGDKMVQMFNNTLTSNATLKWQKPFNDYVYAPSPVKNDAIHVGSQSGKLYVITKDTGAPVYTYQADSATSTHIAAGTDSSTGKNVIAFASNTGWLYLLNDDTTNLAGELIWKTRFDTAPLIGHFTSSPFMTKKAVYIGTEAGEVKGFNLTTGGNPLWTLPKVANPGKYNGVYEVTLSQNRIFAMSESGFLRVYK